MTQTSRSSVFWVSLEQGRQTWNVQSPFWMTTIVVCSPSKPKKSPSTKTAERPGSKYAVNQVCASILHLCAYQFLLCAFMLHLCASMLHLCASMLHLCASMLHLCAYMLHLCAYMFLTAPKHNRKFSYSSPNKLNFSLALEKNLEKINNQKMLC